ncbi:coiled-coil domain-containing protein 152 isoform X1 [Myotis lucifugus]|uniref:coiled-coil domain-containing protein 152 isoform X1 n=2 Tax=Myotis lucifugus TaxID=59463 RepID=UPI000CCC318F|nr:coiled-coil domain-containing protein 152 isoform X1 [Myotis lucifugus]
MADNSLLWQNKKQKTKKQPRPHLNMDQSSDGCVKKISSVNLDKLINDFSQIEKKMVETSGRNNVLNMQLEKANCLLKGMQTNEASLKEECATLHNMVKGLQQTIEYQHNLKGKNEQLKRNADLMKEKLKSHEQEYKNSIAKLISEMKIKEEGHKTELRKLYQDMQKKVELNEEKNKELVEKMEMEISELKAKLKIQEKEKQTEIIKLQLEFDAKLARVQTKPKSYPDSTVLPQSIYRRKLQHLQEEKNKEIATLRNTIRELEQRLSVGKDPHLKRRRF